MNSLIIRPWFTSAGIVGIEAGRLNLFRGRRGGYAITEDVSIAGSNLKVQDESKYVDSNDEES